MPQMQNRVQETTTTGGTGTLTLSGAVTGYITFASGFSTGASLFYTIDNGTGEWEIGIGTLVTTGTLSRVTVIASSNGGALVNFGSGTKRVFCSAPTRSLVPDQDSNSGKVLTTDGTNPAWTQTLNGITIGNLTAAAGAFTTLSASSTVSGTGFSTYLASPPAIGGTTPAAGNFTTLGSTGNTTLGDAAGDTLTINAGTTTFTQGTANGVLYLNGSKVATSGSALTFNGSAIGWSGTNIILDGTSLAASALFKVRGSTGDQWQFGAGIINSGDWGVTNTTRSFNPFVIEGGTNTPYFVWNHSGAEQMRLTSTGLGLGTSSPASKLHVNVASGSVFAQISSGVNDLYLGYDGVSGMQTMQSDTGISFATGASFTERLRIDSSGNLGLGGTSFGSGALVMFIANRTTAPTTNPVGGGILYVEAGALKYRGSSGTVTTIANA